jgi:hypothetical protein
MGAEVAQDPPGMTHIAGAAAMPCAMRTGSSIPCHPAPCSRAERQALPSGRDYRCAALRVQGLHSSLRRPPLPPPGSHLRLPVSLSVTAGSSQTPLTGRRTPRNH